MVARNDITGDAIQTKGNSNSYRDNYDAIFRKGSKMSPSVEQMKQGTCGCGRSPTGDCCGWHGLTQEDFEQRKELYETGKVDLHGKEIK
jgi:hypothetical protein